MPGKFVPGPVPNSSHSYSMSFHRPSQVLSWPSPRSSPARSKWGAAGTHVLYTMENKDLVLPRMIIIMARLVILCTLYLPLPAPSPSSLYGGPRTTNITGPRSSGFLQAQKQWLPPNPDWKQWLPPIPKAVSSSKHSSQDCHTVN